MYRIVACKNLLPFKKVPERLLKSTNTCNASLSRCYSGGGKKKSGHPILYTLGFTSVTAGGVVAYAKFDKDFRLWLEENLPGSDKFIEVVTEEKGVSVVDVVVNKYEDIKHEVETIKTDTLGKIEDLTGFKFESEAPSTSSSPATSSLATKTSLPETPSVVEKKPVEIKPVAQQVTVSDKPSTPSAKPSPPAPTKPSTPTPPASKPAPPADLRSFADLERNLRVWSASALDSLQDGVRILSKFDNRVVSVIDASVERPNDRSGWSELSKLRKETEEALARLEVNASDALKSIENLKSHVNDPKFNASPDQIQALRAHINDAISQVQRARSDFDAQRSRNNVTEKYARRIEEEKRKHQEELSILFPDADSYAKDPAAKNLNLLLLYTSGKIQFYQKELAKLEMQYEKALESRGGDGGALDLAREKRTLAEEFQKKALELQALFEKDIRVQLKRQAEAHSDHLREVLALKTASEETKLSREYEARLFEEKAKYKEQIGVMIGRMKAFEEAFKKRAYAEEAVQHSQALWSACQTLILRIQNSITPQDVKPLKSEIDAIKKSAAKSDTFVETICAAFPSAALSRGVYSEQALRSRFIGVQDSAYRVALVPDESASLPLVFLSYLQSLFIIRGLAAISPEEIRDEPSAKLNSLNTYEILERARYFVDRSDLLQAVKYMNLLQGGAKAVSQQWIADTLVYLETETAAKALLSHAASVSFVQ
ncbi:hypothetical protein M8J76_001210 [Diaphorina citri]|nr:hypothetical protein M8J75_000368 [Diaphorina citri]KAI5713556.1 hypothetical protein M8J76_001210 [Diaphorina citri]